MCLSEVAGGEAEEVGSGDVPADIWFLIVLRNYNRDTKLVTRPVHDCSGRPVDEVSSDAETAKCLLGDAPGKELPDRPLTEDDLMIEPTDDGKMLVWIQATHYDTGEASGPIALAEWTKRGIAVRAIGTLRAHTEKAAIRLEPMGEGKALVVESRTCDPKNPKKCTRLLKIVPKLGAKFVERPLIEESGECIGPPAVDMFREREVKLDNGFVRRFELARSVDFTDGNIVISEQVKIEDTDPKVPDAPPKLFRKASLKRPLSMAARGIVTKAGLWDTMIQEHGSVTYKPEDEKPAGDKPAEEAG